MSQNSKKIKFGAILLLAIAVLGISGHSVYKFLATRSLLEALPSPELTTIESHVADEILRLRAEVEKNPKSDTTWGQFGMILDVHDFKHESLPCYRQAAKLNPDEFQWAYYCAIVLNAMASEETMVWLERGLVLRPDYVPLLILYARTLYDIGQPEKAAKAFGNLLKLQPNSADAYVGLGKVSLSHGALEESRHNLQKAIAANRGNREAHQLLAEVLRRLGDSETAAKELQTAQRLPNITTLADPVYEELVAMGISAFWYRERGLAYQAQGKIDAAIHEYQTALQLKPDPEGLIYVGNLLVELKRYPEAANTYQTALSLNPNYVTAYNNLGTALFEMGQREEAIIWVEKSLRLRPDFPDAYLSLENFYVRTNRTAEAIRTLRRGFKNTGGFSKIALRLSWLLSTLPQSELRDGPEAIWLAKQICEKSNYKDPEALDVLAAAYAETSQFTKAVELSRRAHKLAKSQGFKDAADQIADRITLYKKHRAFRN